LPAGSVFDRFNRKETCSGAGAPPNKSSKYCSPKAPSFSSNLGAKDSRAASTRCRRANTQGYIIKTIAKIHRTFIGNLMLIFTQAKLMLAIIIKLTAVWKINLLAVVNINRRHSKCSSVRSFKRGGAVKW